ncbi:MAG: DUF1802 family protein [Mycobacterium sp.]
MTTLALKEWSAAVHAALDGRQTVLLRKGGIHEKRFEVAARTFALFPTVAHSHAERVRPEHHDLLGPSAADSTDDQIVVRAVARVVDSIDVQRPDALPEIADLHIWTDESVRCDRVDFRPKHRLTVLVLAAEELPEPVLLHRVPEFSGCKSWVDLPFAPLGQRRQVHDDALLRDIAATVRALVGSTS